MEKGSNRKMRPKTASKVNKNAVTPMKSIVNSNAITSIGKGDKLPIIPVDNRRQWVRKDLGAH